MTTDIKELVKRLRVNMHAYGIALEAADALEAMAGGSTREDGQSCNSSDGSSPATAPAPAVCVWKRVDEDALESGCDPDGWTYNPEIKRDTCPSCGKPITFKGAKT